MKALPALSPTLDFGAAARLVLTYLSENLPLAVWMVTRIENGRQTYLFLDEDNSFGLARGGAHAWDDSFCIRLAAGDGPSVSADVRNDPAYADAKANADGAFGSYAAAVICESDGSMFGTLCGLDPKVRADDPAFVSAAPLLQLLGQLLSMALAANRQRDEADRAVSQAEAEADHDVLTGLHNRRGWERLVGREIERFERFADPTAVVMIDLDRLKEINDTRGHEAGDVYIRTAGQALAASVRRNDIVARLGGDEFGILMLGCTEAVAEDRVERLYEDLAAAGVAGSVGWAPISVMRGFPAALAEADQAMYAAKQARRPDGPPSTSAR